MTFLLDVKLALTKCIPQFDSPITTTTDNLSIVGRERDRKYVGGVPNETAGSETSVQVPETKGVVPGRRKGVHAIRGDNNVGYEVVMTVKNSFWRAITTFVVSLEVPENDSLV